MYTIFFAWNEFRSLSFLDVEDMHSLIGRGSNQVLALVVEVQRGDMRFDGLAFDDMCKLLAKRVSLRVAAKLR